MEEKKMTKRDYFEAIKEIVAENTELVEFCDKQIEQLDKKAEKAKARAAERKVEGDELRDTIENLLTEEYQIIDDVLAQLDNEEITKAKVVARLTQLVKNGLAEKAEVKTEDGKKVMAYKLAE